MATILIVDDDAALRRSYRLLFEGEGYAVRMARNADEALEAVAAERPDLVLLDVMMPGRNGFTVCAELRRVDAHLPILMHSAVDADAQRVRGLDMGADDYIVKTASEEELLARIRRALNRAAATAHPAPSTQHPAPSTLFMLGRSRIDEMRRTVTDECGRESHLTASERGILQLLASSRGTFFSNADIIAALRGAGYALEDATIRSQISRLKAKLGAAGALIVNERFSGYAILP